MKKTESLESSPPPRGKNCLGSGDTMRRRIAACVCSRRVWGLALRIPQAYPSPILQKRFVYNGTLRDSQTFQNARFGASIAAVRDLNQDAYEDVVVGAPLEDSHQGAIYIFHGHRGSILRQPKQVRA